MIPRIRVAAGAAVALTLAGLGAGCATATPGTPSPTESGTSAAPGTVAAGVPSPGSDAGQTFSSAAGTALLLSVDGDKPGLYDLRDGQLSLWYGSDSADFSQSAVVSPQGSRIAYVATPGDLGTLRVISGNGTSTDVGPNTVSNAFLPIWSPDGTSVVANVRSTADEQQPGDFSWMTINVTTGTATPMPAPGGYPISTYSPDLAYVLMGDASGLSVAHANGSGVTPVVAPSGKALRVLSLSPDGHHVVGTVKDPGGPQGDAGRKSTANAIVDIRAGDQEAVPQGGDLESGYYLANGDAVLRVDRGGTDTILLVSATNAVLAQQTVPAAAKDYALIGYVPAG